MPELSVAEPCAAEPAAVEPAVAEATVTEAAANEAAAAERVAGGRTGCANGPSPLAIASMVSVAFPHTASHPSTRDPVSLFDGPVIVPGAGGRQRSAEL